jgi:drug/metabolite transporter (DMT)-like permease
VLGEALAVLSAATFALNNAAARRGVVTGTPTQGMVVTIPIGVLCFLPLAALTGGIARLALITPTALAWLVGVGLLHFLVGRYCNYRANQAAGANLTAPVIQLQVVVTLALAVIILREPCTVLQMLGGVLMLAGALITPQSPRGARKARAVAAPIGADAADGKETLARPFVPHQATAYVYASIAALAYGTTPIMVRTALQNSGAYSGIVGGLIAYGAATVAITVGLLSRALRRDVLAMKRENIPWFVCSGVFVAAAQGLFYSAVAVAPIMLVLPLMQLSLLFRLIFSTWLNPHQEVFGPLVIFGTVISLTGACMVSVNTDFILGALTIPEALLHVLRWQL